VSQDDRKRAIGKLISVAADRFVIEMHAGTDNFTIVGFDDVHYVARLGSFLMIPTQAEYVVAEVIGLRERDVSSPGESRDFDRASSSKFLDVVPVGMLPARGSGKFRFGVSVFPSLYADALYALDDELDRIFETQAAIEPSKGPEGGKCVPPEATRYRVLSIGKSVVFEDYDVKVRLDEFFGGHVAVLGNTGSGKSCTVASVLQSLFEKTEEHHARGATFVVFDVNGEYEAALAPLAREGWIGVDRVVLDGTVDGFRLPHWFLDLSEWELLLQASERTQVPILRMALGLSTLFSQAAADDLKGVRNHILAKCITQIMRDDSSSPSKHDRIVGILQRFSTDEIRVATVRRFIRIDYGQMVDAQGLDNFLVGDGGFVIDDLKLPFYQNVPFDFDALGDAMDLAILYEEAHGNRQIRDYCSQMVTRFKSVQERREYAFLRHDRATAALPGQGELDFLSRVVGLKPARGGHTKTKQIVIVDMNAVEDDVVELVSAVIARMIFRLLRHADPRNRFPVHLLLEEAHRYVASTPSRYAVDATKVFERIAKEGRKYGMFVVVASQRPSELSKTVLSQCSNFVVHRIQNPDDLFQIRQMTPFISDAVLKRLPSLPKQHALVFGTSVNLPTTFKVREASPRPRSDDTKIVDLWFHEEDRLAAIRLRPPPHEPGPEFACGDEEADL
jgi:uncharacterized protein